MELLCTDAIPSFLKLFDLAVAPPLLFYSYIPIMILTFSLGLYVLIKEKFALESKLFFLINISFVIWIANILIQWTAAYADMVMLAWQTLAVIEPAIYLLSVYFVLAFTNKKDIAFWDKASLALAFLPIALLLPTTYNIESFDLNNCEGTVGILWNYIYSLEILSFIFIVSTSVRKYLSPTIKHTEKNEALLLGMGVAIFLGLFTISNIIGEVTQVYEVNLFGPVGMLIFIGMLSYMISKFQTFNIKLFGAQILVLTLWFSTFGILFVHSELTNVIVVITLGLITIFGYFLIRSISREIKQREHIEKLANRLADLTADLRAANELLEDLNRQKTEFVSMASHQLRSPLTAIKGYSSMLLEGSFGQLPDKAKEGVRVVFESSQKLVNVIEDFLNITRIELGKMKYEMTDFDLRELVQNVVREMQPSIDRKGIKLEVNIPEGNYDVHGDLGKLSQVISNIIDNSLKYTPRGEVKVGLNQEDGKVLFKVQDTGVGIPAESLPKLFQKFIRADEAGKTNIQGTGLGLYVAKQIVEAHRGRIWAESAGPGKGATFYVELPAKA